MARRRNRSEAGNTATQNEVNNTTDTKESNTMALSQEEIAELLSGSRTRGAGTEVIKEFLDSGEAGREVDLTSGPLAGKEPGQAFNTLNNAKKRTKTDESGSTVLAMPEAAKVRVYKRDVNKGSDGPEDYRVFLINTDLVEIPA